MNLRQLFEEPRTAVIAFGRMNPPTIGHAKLVDAVKSQQGDQYLFLSQSQKPKTDPLAFEDKLRYAKFFFPNITIGHPEVKTIIQALKKISDMGYENLIYVAGSDRVQAFEELINKYNGGDDYSFKNIQVVSAGERDPDADGAEGMSASKMRAAAAAGDLESFKQGVPNQEVADEMYNAVRKGMGVQEPEMAEDVSPEDEDKFHNELDDLVHKYFGDSPDEEKMKKKYRVKEAHINEALPAVVAAFATVGGLLLGGALAYKDAKLTQDWMEAYKEINLQDPDKAREIKKLVNRYKSFTFKNQGFKNLTREKIEKIIADAKPKNRIEESDVVIDPTQLRQYLRMLIDDAIDKEQDIDKLSKVLKLLIGKEIKSRGKRYSITSEDVFTAFEASCKNRRKKKMNEESVELPDGSTKDTNPDGSYTISSAKGKEYFDKNGKLIKTISPLLDGLATIRYADGRARYIFGFSGGEVRGPLVGNKPGESDYIRTEFGGARFVFDARKGKPVIKGSITIGRLKVALTGKVLDRPAFHKNPMKMMTQILGGNPLAVLKDPMAVKPMLDKGTAKLFLDGRPISAEQLAQSVKQGL